MSFFCVLCVLCGNIAAIIFGTDDGYGKGGMSSLQIIMHNFGGIINNGTRSRFKK
jgi:hypothetical protein